MLFVSSTARFFLRLLLGDDMDDEASNGNEDDLLSACENELGRVT